MTKFFLIFIITIFSNSILSQLPYYLPSDGLVGWWPFNGNANDESGNGNDGIIVNSMLCQDRFGNESAAFDFNSTDGEEKYIRCLNNETFILVNSRTIIFKLYTIFLDLLLKRKCVSCTEGDGTCMHFAQFTRF